MAFRNIRVAAIVLLASQVLWAETSYSQSPTGDKFGREVSKQEIIYQSKGALVPEGYSIDRSLADYTSGLPAGFDRALESLGPNDRWLDIGAGQGWAILNYYVPDYNLLYPRVEENKKKAKSVAISIEDRRTPAWSKTSEVLESGQIRYLFGKRFGEYTAEDLGKFRLITDFLGGFSYTETLSRFLEKVLGSLEVNGSFYTVLQDVGSDSGGNKPHYPDARFLTEITDADGSPVKVCSWLKRITCVEVTCQFRTGWRPPLEAYRMQRVCENVSVPDLEMVHFEAGTPPERRFRSATLPRVTPVQDSQATVKP